MATNINVTVDAVTLTGLNVSVPQRRINATVTYTDVNGQPQTKSGSVLFPNVLGDPAIPTAWLQRRLLELMLDAERIILGVDTP